jgi:hypothetical protein
MWTSGGGLLYGCDKVPPLGIEPGKGRGVIERGRLIDKHR